MLFFNQTAQNTVRIFEEFLFLQSNKYANSVYKMKVDKKKKIYKYRIFVEKNSRGPGMSIGHWDLICNVGSHWFFFFQIFFSSNYIDLFGQACTWEKLFITENYRGQSRCN